MITLPLSVKIKRIYLFKQKYKNLGNIVIVINIPYIAIIGEDERKSGRVTIKNIKTGEQNTLTINEAIEFLKR